MEKETVEGFKCIMDEVDKFLTNHPAIEFALVVLLIAGGIWLFTKGATPILNLIKGFAKNKLGIPIDDNKENSENLLDKSEIDDVSIEEIMLTIDELDSRINTIKSEITKILSNLEELHNLSKEYEKNSSDILQKCEKIQSELTHIKEISEKNHSNISDKISGFERLIEKNFKILSKDIENLQNVLAGVERDVDKLKDILMLKGYIKKDDDELTKL